MYIYTPSYDYELFLMLAALTSANSVFPACNLCVLRTTTQHNSQANTTATAPDPVTLS